MSNELKQIQEARKKLSLETHWLVIALGRDLGELETARVDGDEAEGLRALSAAVMSIIDLANTVSLDAAEMWDQRTPGDSRVFETYGRLCKIVRYWWIDAYPQFSAELLEVLRELFGYLDFVLEHDLCDTPPDTVPAIVLRQWQAIAARREKLCRTKQG